MTHPPYPASCPSCGSTAVARIEFGLPVSIDALRPDLDSGLVILGGCDVSDNSPQWHCQHCHHEWGITELAPHIQENRRKSEDERAAKESNAIARGVLTAELYPDGDVRCPHCNRVFTTNFSMSWDGSRHKTCGTYLTLVPKVSNA